MKHEHQKFLHLFFWLALSAAVDFCIRLLHSPFVYDDKIEVIGNRTIRDLSNWQAIAGYNPSLFFSIHICMESHQAQPTPFDPKVYHITNLVIHCLGIGTALWMCLGIHPLVHDKKSFPSSHWW